MTNLPAIEFVKSEVATELPTIVWYAEQKVKIIKDNATAKTKVLRQMRKDK